MAAPVIAAQGDYLVGSTTTTADIPPPAGLVSGDLPAAALLLESTATPTPVDAGWQLWDPAGLGYTFAQTESTMLLYVRIYHYEPRTPPSSWVFNWTGATWRAAKSLRITGALASGSPFRYGGPASMASHATLTNPAPVTSFTGYQLDDLGLWVLAHFRGWGAGLDLADATPEADWTLLNPTDVDRDMAFAHKPRTAAGDLVDFTVPATGRNGEQAAMLLAVMPAAGSGISVPMPTVVEVDDAVALGRSKAKAVPTAAEVDTAEPFGQADSTVVPMPTVTETDSAVGFGRAKAKAVPTAAEVDTARSLTTPIGEGIDITVEVGPTVRRDFAAVEQSEQRWRIADTTLSATVAATVIQRED